MRKKILFAPLWGIFALSLLSSCRTEDNLVQQNKTQEAKYFSVFVPKSGEKINYANGFAFLMKRYDELHKTNLSGINNNPVLRNLSASTSKNASVFQSTGVYVEFAVRSQTITEENGDKWVVFPKIEGSKVVSLVAAVLSQKETYVSYHTISEGDELYKRNINRFQEALARYQKQRVTLALNASINPMAGSGCSNNGVEYDNCGIPEVVIDVPPRGGGGGGTGFPDGGGSGCLPYELCDPGVHQGGGGSPAPNPNQEIINNLEKYPCAQKLLEQLPNLNNSLAKILNDALATNSKIKVTFVGGPLKGDKPGGLLAGRTSYVSTNNETGVVSYNIILNQDVLKSATQEYTLALMYHESIHAFLLNQHTVLGADEFFRKYPYLENYVVGGVTKFKFIPGNHQAYGPFVNMIADAIQSYNPKFPRDRAISLAMEGITEEDLPNNGDSYNTIERYSGDTAVGTKCAKP
ncbi:hypothetical protein HZR02_11450 [Elizabethkingia anophelis]|nr:hypothetical protein [Elizabethkingia anophelis]MCT3659504.1 hypothetical protein [Elizabethkingia anophelis]MCT3666669.1 hypothetical protein [Elizabethkingia anophelis]MCT3852697.1 hypothetical protein [Elizabethkingia anophelis]MCT3863514.1 hypothetical protein [Elizabethkingia anophelis]